MLDNIDLPDPFLDSYNQELFACHAIIDKMKISDGNIMTITFNKKFLDRFIHSYIHLIRKIV